MSITLNAGQQEAIGKYMDFLIDPTKTEMVIEGPAGTGKSTLVDHLLFGMNKQKLMLFTTMGIHADKLKNVILTATTHKAAHVLSEKTGKDVKTIHSLLGLKVHNDWKTGKTILKPVDGHALVENSILLIDEASFIDSDLLGWIRKSTINCKILYVGDPYQLAPTRSTSTPVFTQGLFTARLTEVVRNEGAIEKNANAFRDAVQTLQFPLIEPDGNKVIHVDGTTFQQMINQEFVKPDHNSKIIAWSNNRVNQYNDYVRELNGFTGRLDPNEELITNKHIEGTKSSIKTDSHVRLTGACYEAEEYDVLGYKVGVHDGKGTHMEIFIPDSRDAEKQALRAATNQKLWPQYFDIKESWGDLRPVHACTIHKSQGSTYDKVFIDLSDIGRCNISSDVARMLYVAISRASQQVILYGQLPQKYGGLANAA
ncbi:MAG: ATP-dependent DNA helicase [Neptuniibacter sp.]